MKTFTKNQLESMLAKHAAWIRGEAGGMQADFRDADLRWSNFIDADLRWANFSGANLSESCLSGANLCKANLRKANLRKANLSGVCFRGTDLSEADLSEADLSDAELSAANLHEADLSEADLSDANLKHAFLNRANLNGANLSGAVLTNAALPAGPAFQASAGKHLLTVYDGIAWIGCIKMPLKSLLRNYKEIGAEHGYSKPDIAIYGELLKLAAKHQSRVKRGIK
jgi:hypothetical protein